MEKIYLSLIFLLIIYIKFYIINSYKNSNHSDNLKNEIIELGFDEEKVDLALQISNDKEDICYLIIKMMEDPDFFIQMKSKFKIQKTNIKNNEKTKVNSDSINIVQNLSNTFTKYKMVYIIRKDLNLNKINTLSQFLHIVLGEYKSKIKNKVDTINVLENLSRQKKILFFVENEKQLLEIKNQADKNGIISILFNNGGKIEASTNSSTCCIIGPDINYKIEKMIDKLKLTCHLSTYL